MENRTLEPSKFAAGLIVWYEKNKRDLPWRETTDPYRIWLSEIILQQTRVQQGLPYYYNFVTTYPTVASLAKADERDVLRLWQGLGYYSRARNLHACAKKIVAEYQGSFPNNYQALLQLPGVGSYTAAAIASFAYHENVAVLDGNVFRVLSRIFGIDEDILSGRGRKVFERLAEQLISADDPATYNQAIMEFGALHCTPKMPQCHECSFETSCVASQLQMQHLLPVKISKVKVKKRYLHYIIVHHQEKIFMKERIGKDIWSGLYDFHAIEETELHENFVPNDDFLNELVANQAFLFEKSSNYKHVLTHQIIHAKFYHYQLEDKKTAMSVTNKYGFGLYNSEEINLLPKPILIVNYLNGRNF